MPATGPPIGCSRSRRPTASDPKTLYGGRNGPQAASAPPANCALRPPSPTDPAWAEGQGDVLTCWGDNELLGEDERLGLCVLVTPERSPVRALVALHVAAALVWSADLLLWADESQCLAASQAGLWSSDSCSGSARRARREFMQRQLAPPGRRAREGRRSRPHAGA